MNIFILLIIEISFNKKNWSKRDNMQKILAIKLVLLISTMINAQLNFASTNCKCQIGDLIELEKLNSDLKRLRIEMPNGLKKYSNNFLTYNSFIDCYSIGVYESLLLNSRENFCRKCLPSIGWTSIQSCDTETTPLKCDLDSLNGVDFILESIDSRYKIHNEQNLFEVNRVVAKYHQANRNLCRLCESNGEWSRLPDRKHCLTPKNMQECSYQALQQIEYQKFDYVRIRIESPNGLNKIDEKTIREKQRVPSGSVVLYQKYLSSLNITLKKRLEKLKSGGGRFMANNYFNPFTKKFCRYCNDGAWSDIESCVHLTCDRDQLTGTPELLYLKNDRQFRSLMSSFSDRNSQLLFRPNSVVAVYSYGSDKFCKLCHENGEWSKYSLTELCKNNEPSSLILERPQSIYEDIYLKEIKCPLKDLFQIESNFTRSYFVSPDRKQKFTIELSDHNLLLPSRTLSLYRQKVCSQCVNGAWSSIGNDCTRSSLDLKFCEREILTEKDNITSIRIDSMMNMLDDKEKYQTLFQPGRVMVMYKLDSPLSTVQLCKICEENGEWSKYAEAKNCDPNIAFYSSNPK